LWLIKIRKRNTIILKTQLGKGDLTIGLEETAQGNIQTIFTKENDSIVPKNTNDGTN
jgi:hypothetical protein